MKRDPTQAELKRLVTYNPETGVFTRNATGKPTGCPDRNGYLRIGIGDEIYFAHRLAVLYMTGSMPTLHMDHIDHVTDNNRWLNLREAEVVENRRNSLKRSDNTSGHKGVSWDEKRQKWVARVANRHSKYKFLEIGRAHV